MARQARKVRFESYRHLLLLDRGVAQYAIKTPFFEIEVGESRQRPPSILWFGGSCSSFDHFLN